MAEVYRLRTADAPAELLEQIRRLLLEAFEDGDFSVQDWASTLGGWHVVLHEDGIVVAHAAVVPRILHVGGRPVPTGYVEGVATAPSRQGEGLGSRAMRAVAALLPGEAEMGALSTGRHAFYRRLGWERWRGPTYVRRGTGLERTPDDDDGVMVLRFGASRDVDLAAPIACEERPGDDW